MRWLLFAWLVSLTIVLTLELRGNDMPSTGGGLTEQQQQAQEFADVYALIDQVNARIPKYMDAKFWSGLTPKAGQVPIFDGATKRFKPGIVYILKSATEDITSSTTLQNDDELLFTVGKGEEWSFFLFLGVIGASAGDFKVAVAPAAGTTAGAFFFGLQEAATDNNALRLIHAAAGGSVNFGCLGTPTPVAPVMIWGIAQGLTGAGPITLQWAQATSNGTATSVAESSYLIAQRLK